MSDKSLLFFGDLAPEYLTGTGIAAMINLEILKDNFRIYHIPENDNWSYHGKITLRKIFHYALLCLGIFRMVKEKNIDVFYLHLSTSIPGLFKNLFSVISAKIAGVRSIVFHLHRGDFKYRYYRSWMYRNIFGILHKGIDGIILLSEQHKYDLEECGIVEKTFVLENTIEFVNSGLRVNYDRDNFRFLFISNYIKEKGVLDLLEAYKRFTNGCKGTELHLYGDIFNNSTYRDMLAISDNIDSVFINGPVYNKDMKSEVLCDAMCLVLPSWNEGQPLVLLEAMAVGLPVIATDVGFIKETLGPDYPYLVKPRDIEQLSETLEKVYRDNTLDKLGEGLYNRYSKKYSKTIHKDRLLSIFYNL